MTKRETVMSWLEGLTCYDLSEWHSYNEVQKIAKAALELLKEQEPNEPIRMHHTEHKQTDNYRCRECGNDLYFEQRFCDVCGKAAKWNYGQYIAGRKQD